MNQQIVKHLRTVKEVIEAVNITLTADDGNKKEGLATKRKNVLWKIENHEDVDIISELAEKNYDKLHEEERSTKYKKNYCNEGKDIRGRSKDISNCSKEK
eukprot:9158700-Ditylum_brightwellii.AAC.1